jgi:hypothetical protein
MHKIMRTETNAFPQKRRGVQWWLWLLDISHGTEDEDIPIRMGRKLGGAFPVFHQVPSDCRVRTT